MNSHTDEVGYYLLKLPKIILFEKYYKIYVTSKPKRIWSSR
jgi:hypothetical protein